jgi:wyosine [tRNA(Phe)-imidazoG37] synthetase (radical SAM superfamily)
MEITYTHTHGIIASLPAGDELARHAADAYGHTLNTPERCNRPHGARDFAQAIREIYDMAEPRNAAIVEHLESLEPDDVELLEAAGVPEETGHTPAEDDTVRELLKTVEELFTELNSAVYAMSSLHAIQRVEATLERARQVVAKVEAARATA